MTEEQREGLTSLMRQVEEGACIMIGSALLITQLLSLSGEHLERAFDGRRGVWMPVDPILALKARELQQKCYKLSDGVLSCEDAIHLCTASLAKCSRFVTFDKKPDNKNRILAPLKHRAMLEPELGLKIIDPSECRPLVLQPELIAEEEFPPGQDKLIEV